MYKKGGGGVWPPNLLPIKPDHNQLHYNRFLVESATQLLFKRNFQCAKAEEEMYVFRGRICKRGEISLC